MSQYPGQVGAAFSQAPFLVQGALGIARAGTTMLVQAVAGEPDTLEAAAPQYREIARQVAELSSSAAEASNINGWEGQAREAFDAKVKAVADQTEALSPQIAQTADLLVQAAQTSRRAAEQIVNTVQQTIQMITAAYQKVKAAAAVSLGQAIAAFIQWVISMGAQIVSMVRQIGEMAAGLLSRAGAMLQRLGSLVQQGAQRIKQLVEGLDIPGAVNRAIDVVGNWAKGVYESAKGDMSHDAWEKDFGAEDSDHKNNQDFTWGNQRKTLDTDGDGEADAVDLDGDGVDDDSGKSGVDVGAKATLLEAEEEVSVASGEVSGETDLGGGASASGEASGSVLYAGGEASVYADEKGIGAEATARLGLVEGSASGEVGWDHAKAKGEVSGFVGGEANATAHVGREGGEASFDAFAGGKVEASGTVEAAGVGATGTAEGWAGIGIEGDINATYEDGKLTFGGSGGAALGVGGKLGFEVEIDVNEAVDTIKDVGDFLGF